MDQPKEDKHFQDDHGIQRDVTPWHTETPEEYLAKLYLAFHNVKKDLEVRK